VVQLGHSWCNYRVSCAVVTPGLLTQMYAYLLVVKQLVAIIRSCLVFIRTDKGK
jgi:hypothetical protein